MSLDSGDRRTLLADEERQNYLAQCLQSLKRWILVVCSPLQEAAAGSLVLWFIFVFISVGTYFLLVVVTALEGKNSYIIADLVLIIFMVVGFLLQIICLCKISNPNFVQFGRLGHDHSTMYLIAGIYVFGVGTLFTILIRLLTYYHAHELIVHCHLQNISQTPVVQVLPAGIQNGASRNSTHPKEVILFGGFCSIGVVFDLARLLFTLLQLYFIQAFCGATFNRSFFVQFALYHTMLTNGCVWIRYVVDETHLFRHSEYHSSIDEIITKALQMEGMMTPFILEYSLLAAGLLYTISSHMKDISNNVGVRESMPQEVRSSNLSSPQITSVHAMSEIPINTRNSLTIVDYLPASSVQDGGSVGSALQPEVNCRQGYQGAPGSQPGLIFGTFCGLLLLVSSLMFNREQNKFNRRSHDLFLAYEGILALLQITAIYCIFKMLQYHKKSAQKFHFEDTLLMIGFMGIVLFHGFTIYSVVVVVKNSSENKGTVVISIIHLFVLVISQVLQTFLIITSSRYSLIRAQKSSARRIRQLVLFMLTTNLGFWVLDSFVEMKDNASSSYPSGKHALKHVWKVMTSILYPFVVFYRFHSAEMLYEFWSRFGMKKNRDIYD